MMKEELKDRIAGLRAKFQELRGFFDLDNKNNRILVIEQKISSPDFWSQKQQNAQILKELKVLKANMEGFKKISRELQDLSELLEISEEKEAVLLSIEADKIEAGIKNLEFETYLSGEHDADNAIMSIHAGAGGTESCDWSSMLIRMYSRWAENKGYKMDMLDVLPGEEAGIKRATFLIKGSHAYGFLKAEKGVHRLVRISPFDANKKRHTSFALVELLPEVEEVEVEIDEKDLKVDTCRSSGAGGQHVNVTDSAIRITHIPSGIVVECQNERSQHKNKSTAMKILRARLYELGLQKQREEIEQMKVKGDIGWGYQIRSYVLHPYTMVKDHRTGIEVGNAQGVLDGDIDCFIEAFLKKKPFNKTIC
ncbi:MAG: peptide chain release factor 2 [Candidatus Omnitrophica bacterium]|nr:peptide chain release factor 2 [Candidatus Omnitrophota bacterium]